MRLFLTLDLFSVLAPRGRADLSKGLLGYWPFDGDPSDHSGNGLDLTLHVDAGFGAADAGAG